MCGINRELTQFACSASFLVCVCVRVSVRVDGKRTVDTAAGGGGGCLLKKKNNTASAPISQGPPE